MQIVCLDLEGVLVPEIWISLAERSGIDELRLTTRDIPDYDELMRRRLEILNEHDLGLPAIQAASAAIAPLDGAADFLAWLRARFQVIILSDTYYEIVQPLMRSLGWPTIFCHRLQTDEAGRIIDYGLRQKDHKTAAVRALHTLNFGVFAAGDSYNDAGMLAAADAGFLFAAPDNVAADFPQFTRVADYAALQDALLGAASDMDARARLLGHRGKAMPKVLITGANRGIGLEFVRQYDADGWHVIACCRAPDVADALHDIAAASGGRVTVATLDVLNHATIDAAAKAHTGEPIDVVINNAGIIGPRGEVVAQQQFGAMDYEEWVRVLRTNTLGPMKMSEAFANNVAASDQKKIVHISSTIGSNAEEQAQVFSYGASKAALTKVSTLMAAALRERGITVLALCPGHVKDAGMGGPGADVELIDSIAGMRTVISAAGLADTGSFRRYNGDTVAF